MPYPDGFNHEEKLKLAMLWGKHENYDRVRWEFAKFYELIASLVSFHQGEPRGVEAHCRHICGQPGSGGGQKGHCRHLPQGQTLHRQRRGAFRSGPEKVQKEE